MQFSPETLRFIQEHAQDDVRPLALQAHKYPLVDVPAAIQQIAGRQAAGEKIPSWQAVEGIVYPRHLSLEQCSSELTARYKAELVKGETLTDLTGGLGIDCAFLAAGFRQAVYVERQEELCEIASHNFPLLGLNHITVCNEDGVKHLEEMAPVDCLFIDPARRNEHGGKTVAIADCEPDVAALEELLLSKARQVIIKLSPMLDLTLTIKDMKHVTEAHIVSVNNECKELLLILEDDNRANNNSPLQANTPSIPTVCVNITPHSVQRFVFTREEEQASECSYTDQTGSYLYEPNASLLKAGAFRCVAKRYGLKKLHPNSHLYTSDTLVEEFPGRVFEISRTCTFNKKEMKEALGNIKKANISIRNFPASVAELRKRIKMGEGGDDYLFATTLNNNQKLLILGRKTTHR